MKNSYLLKSIRLLTNAAKVFSEKCIAGISADRERIEQQWVQSLTLTTALAPQIGYYVAVGIAKKAHATGKMVCEMAIEENILPPDELEKVLDPHSMVEPQ